MTPRPTWDDLIELRMSARTADRLPGWFFRLTFRFRRWIRTVVEA